MKIDILFGSIILINNKYIDLILKIDRFVKLVLHALRTNGLKKYNR